MTKDKLFKREYARELLAIAAGDLGSAELMATDQNKGRRENICYAAQQSIEKAQMAVICAQGDANALTHSIEFLLDKVKGSAPPHGDELIELTDFATVKRYQEGNEIITAEDISATIGAAKKVLIWAQAKIDALLS